LAWDDEERDSNSPSLPYVDWFENDDIEHLFGSYADSWIFVNDENQENPIQIAEQTCLLDREHYMETEIPEEEKEDYIPVLMVHSHEKGCFGGCEIETDNFDLNKLWFYILQSNACDIVTKILYDGKEIEFNDEDLCTDGKSMNVSVGWIQK
jgi:hypothetical protein